MHFPDTRLAPAMMQNRLEERARAAPSGSWSHAIGHRWSWLGARGRRIEIGLHLATPDVTARPVMD